LIGCVPTTKKKAIRVSDHSINEGRIVAGEGSINKEEAIGYDEWIPKNVLTNEKKKDP